MRDGAIFAKAGLPAVAIVTEAFVELAAFTAQAVGMPAVPRCVLPHPCSGTGDENLARVAREAAPGIIALLEGRVEGRKP
ncbi:MAG: hypothetical protein F4Z38_10590 [Chloroflexi bacterium]|nr:hypothetical protein [Chloroflexota bacterium]MXY86712.1 hypothetical protein [Chloroflexota bacterium]